MSKKIIKLTESDLEKIVRRVIEENEHQEVVERLGDQLKAKVAGVAGDLKARQHNRKELRKDRKSAIRTGKRTEVDLQDPIKQKAMAQFASLSNSLVRDVKTASDNMEKVFAGTNLDDLGQEGQMIKQYHNALKTVIKFSDQMMGFMKK